MMPETWRPIPGFPKHEASSEGRIRRANTAGHWRAGRLIHGTPDRKGYLRAGIEDRSEAVHRLVCAAFHGPPAKGQLCRHLDDDRTNNRPENLAWGTMVENAQDAKRNGRQPRVNRLFDREEARALRKKRMTYRAIAARLGVSHVAVVLGLR